MTIDKHRARLDYQRDFMRARRRRVAKALALVVMTTGPMGRPAATEFKRGLTLRWAKAKTEWMATNASNYMSNHKAVEAFWAEIDQRLDENIERARKVRL